MAPVLVDLPSVRARDLEPVLRAQQEFWLERLALDAGAAIGSIRRLLERNQLAGLGVLAGGRPVGYGYFAANEASVAVADMFILAAMRTPGLAQTLLEGTVRAAARAARVKRVEGQIPCLCRFPEIRVGQPGRLQIEARTMMIRAGLAALPRRPLAPRFRIAPWTDVLLHEASDLMARAYAGHVDAEISEACRTRQGALRLLRRLVVEHSSGRFLPFAGSVIREAGRPGLAGMCLGSRASEGVGHITQLCVAPGAQRCGIGWDLMCRTLAALAGSGCKSVTLTVTASNRPAVRLYERAGFRALATFPAFAWEPA